MFNKIKSLFFKDLPFDESFGFPKIKEFDSLLQRNEFFKVENLYKSSDWAERHLLIKGIAHVIDFRDKIELWHNTTKSPVSTLFIGAHHVFWAWEERSSSRAHELTEDQVDGFYKQLQIAYDYLIEAIELNPNDAECYVQIMPVLRGFSEDLEVINSYFEKAIKLCPEHLPAHIQMTNALNPKWLGSLEEMNSFAAEALKKNHPLLATVMLFAISEHHLYFSFHDMDEEYQNFYKTPEIKSLILDIYKNFREPQTGKALLPLYRNYMAYSLYLIDEDASAKSEMLKCNFSGSLLPWGYIGISNNTELKKVFA